MDTQSYLKNHYQIIIIGLLVAAVVLSGIGVAKYISYTQGETHEARVAEFNVSSLKGSFKEDPTLDYDIKNKVYYTFSISGNSETAVSHDIVISHLYNYVKVSYVEDLTDPENSTVIEPVVMPDPASPGNYNLCRFPAVIIFGPETSTQEVMICFELNNSSARPLIDAAEDILIKVEASQID